MASILKQLTGRKKFAFWMFNIQNAIFISMIWTLLFMQGEMTTYDWILAIAFPIFALISHVMDCRVYAKGLLYEVLHETKA